MVGRVVVVTVVVVTVVVVVRWEVVLRRPRCLRRAGRGVVVVWRPCGTVVRVVGTGDLVVLVVSRRPPTAVVVGVVDVGSAVVVVERCPVLACGLLVAVDERLWAVVGGNSRVVAVGVGCLLPAVG